MQEISLGGETLGQERSHGELEALHTRLTNQEGNFEQGASASCVFSPV